jgi:hypothetical protein
MAAINTDQVKMGFWIATGFLILGLLLGLIRALLMKAKA